METLIFIIVSLIVIVWALITIFNAVKLMGVIVTFEPLMIVKVPKDFDFKAFQESWKREMSSSKAKFIVHTDDIEVNRINLSDSKINIETCQHTSINAEPVDSKRKCSTQWPNVTIPPTKL